MKKVDRFDHEAAEVARQKLWEHDNVHQVTEDPSKEKYFIVDMFPYPSGSGIHVGHVKNYVATDVQARMRTRQGQNVLHPMGYDSFGLPAENYALSQHIHPRVAVEKNVERFGDQLRRLGLAYDWDRQINTIDDDFVKWTQEGFLTLYDAGLVSEEHEPINWCGSCKTGLSNEDLDGTCCERCGQEVERRLTRQWSVHITKYADQLLEGMEELDEWEPFLLDIQRNWIGRKDGWSIEATLASTSTNQQPTAASVFVMDPTQLASAHYLALSPETAEKLGLEALVEDASKDTVKDYIRKNLYKRDKDRNMSAGVIAEGISFMNPFTDNALPVIISEAILQSSDNGAMLGDSAGSEKYRKLGETFGLIEKKGGTREASMDEIDLEQLHELGVVSPTKIYRLEDWVFSRQRFWGEPIPIIHCDECGAVPVPRDQLPVLLPDVEGYELTDDGKSPLANIDEWVNVQCPDCAGPAKRETNTMPQWAGSSWYWHRYKDPHNEERLVDADADRYWGQVDMYVGGAEHAARHLIYARFWNFVLKEAGVVIDKEPFKKVQHIGLVMDENGVKISKRLNNGVNIDEIVETYGSDALRLGVMQMGEFSQQTNWNNREIISARKFLDKVWEMQYDVSWDNDTPLSANLAGTLVKSISKVTEDINSFKFNTAVAQIRILQKELAEHPAEAIPRDAYVTMLSLLQPFAPHMTEEVLFNHGLSEYMMRTEWPSGNYDTAINEPTTREVVVQAGKKKLGVFAVSIAATQADAILDEIRAQSSTINDLFEQSSVQKVIAPEGKNLINLVITR